MPGPDDTLGTVRLVIDNAQTVDAPRSDDDDGDRGGGDGGALQLPDKCPVTPLGVLGDVFFYLDAMQQLRPLPAREHSRLGILALFGSRNFMLEDFWPRKTRTTGEGGEEIFITTGWKPERAAEALMASAAARGVWNPIERVRGRGAWIGDNGELFLHCGDVVLAGGKWCEPGLLGKHVYPASSPTLRPAFDREGRGANNTADWLFALLKSWNWRRKEIDALLLLGWIGAALVGGALDWRPLAWITGGAGTGKSTLHKLIGRLFDSGLVQVSETSPAGIWQKLGHSTLPVEIDELEAEEDNRRTNAVIKLARQAASGGLILRGGADHQAAEFTARSCFMFSSVLMPPLLGQDRSRMAILELGELQGETPPDLAPAKLREAGSKLLRRLVDGWPRMAETLEIYRTSLLTKGHSARGADVFGTLLACADLMLKDRTPDSDSVAEFTDKLDAVHMAEIDDNARDEERCLQHILSSAIVVAGGVKRSVAEYIERAASDNHEDDWQGASRVLGTYGMKVLRKTVPYVFAVANYHVELAKLFEGTHWGGRSGTMGVWVQALRRLPGAERSTENVRCGGTSGKATLMPISLVVSKPDEQDRRERDASLLEHHR